MNTLKEIAVLTIPIRASGHSLLHARSMILALVIALFASAAQAQFYHRQFMRGQVVAAADDQVVLCIGSNDGAEIGQVLDAYELIYDGEIQEGMGDNWRREHAGQVTIEAIIDEHFARAKVTSGEVEKHDMVELQLPSK